MQGAPADSVQFKGNDPITPLFLSNTLACGVATQFDFHTLTGTSDEVLEAKATECVKMGYKANFEWVSGQRFEVETFIQEGAATGISGAIVWTDVPYSKSFTRDYNSTNKDDSCAVVLPVEITSGRYYRLAAQMPSPADALDQVELSARETSFWAEEL